MAHNERATEADREAVRLLLGCQGSDDPVCWWVGVVLVQYKNTLGPVWRSCREHAAPYRKQDEYRVIDTGLNNQRIPELSQLRRGIAIRYAFAELYDFQQRQLDRLTV